jgi:HD-like signal output (HDOD) protein
MTAALTVDQTTRVGLKVRELSELPPLSPVAHQLIGLLADDRVSATALARTIELDPGLTARLVGLARSAFFGYGGDVYTVRDAIVRVLGLETVKSLALTLAMTRQFRFDPKLGVDLPRYWAASLLAASVARRLSPRVTAAGAPAPDVAYLCGLLHDLGLLVLTHVFADDFARVRQATEDPLDDEALLQAERDLIGVDHHFLGGLLADRWHLPPEVVVTLAHHHQADYRGRHWVCARLIGLCATAAHHWLDASEQPAEWTGASELEIAPEWLAETEAWARTQVAPVRELAESLTRAR